MLQYLNNTCCGHSSLGQLFLCRALSIVLWEFPDTVFRRVWPWSVLVGVLPSIFSKPRILMNSTRIQRRIDNVTGSCPTIHHTMRLKFASITFFSMNLSTFATPFQTSDLVSVDLSSSFFPFSLPSGESPSLDSHQVFFDLFRNLGNRETMFVYESSSSGQTLPKSLCY